MVCRALGPIEQLEWADLPAPTAGPGQVHIQVAAAGVNFLDTLIVQGRYQVKPPLPFVPGGEVSGIVRSVGAGVTSLRPGQRVGALMAYGGFAEEVIASEQAVFPIPDSLDFIAAAAFVVAYGTSHHALTRRADLQPGETLLVLGAAGGVGLTAVEIGKRLGARVIAAASSAQKLALCKQYGADECINYLEGDLRTQVKELTSGEGVDVIYDPVGGPLAEPAIRSLRFLGRYLVVGFANGEIPKIAANLLLLRSAGALGVAWGAFFDKYPAAARAEIQTLMSWHADGMLHPHVSAVFPLERCVDALVSFTRRQVHGKVVLVPSPGAFSG